ncbi:MULTISPECIES: hypothetical protein [Sorangium]
MPTMSRATVLVPSLSSPVAPEQNVVFSPDFPLEEREGKAWTTS